MSLIEKKESATKYCHVCGNEKSLGSFIYFNGKQQAHESTVCYLCNKTLRQVESYCSKILEGVFIPSYETPIVKYHIAPNV